MITFLLVAQITTNLPFLSPVFGSHMVLQRDKDNSIWGWSKPGEKVTVQILKTKETATTDATGKWMVKIRPPRTGGPYKMTVSGSQTIELDDILVGDVWVCSGQSNMEMGVAMAKDAQREIRSANFPKIRLYTVPKSPSISLRPFVKGEWAQCSPESIAKGGWGGFSAVGYYFGREMHRELNVPIGLVHTSWGGTPAESWTSDKGLDPFREFRKQTDAVEAMAKPGALSTTDLVEKWVKDNGEDLSGANVDDSDWETVDLPARFNRIGLGGHRGVVWFRKTVELPLELPNLDAYLVTGSNDGVDMNYLNGVRVGSGNGVLNWRNHHIPAGTLKPGKNVVTIRLVGNNPNAGFTTGADNFDIRFGNTIVPLGGKWKMKKGFEIKSSKPMPDLVEDNPRWPTTLYNGMINPLMPMAIKGAIWYQGESNVGRADQYERLLPSLINDWRKGFNQGDFPFFVVQLANYGKQNGDPVNSAWAELREAQETGVERAKNAAMAVTIDIGDGQDIHPTNKQEVGRRLALQALKLTFNRRIEASGPTFKKVTKGGAVIQIEFDNAEGLEIRNAKHSGFAIAGRNGKFEWADAKVIGKTVILSAPGVKEPTQVRYAWDDDPVVTLFNKVGLPAAPFRTK